MYRQHAFLITNPLQHASRFPDFHRGINFVCSLRVPRYVLPNAFSSSSELGPLRVSAAIGHGPPNNNTLGPEGKQAKQTILFHSNTNENHSPHKPQEERRYPVLTKSCFGGLLATGRQRCTRQLELGPGDGLCEASDAQLVRGERGRREPDLHAGDRMVLHVDGPGLWFAGLRPDEPDVRGVPGWDVAERSVTGGPLGRAGWAWLGKDHRGPPR